MPWQKAIERGFKRQIAAQNLPVHFYTEYLDGGRFPLDKTSDAIYELIKAKYQDMGIDVMVSEGLVAANMMKRAAKLFPNAQKIAVRGAQEAVYSENPDLWHIFVRENYPRAISTVLKLTQPEQLVVVADVASLSGKKRLAEFKLGLNTLSADLPVTYLTSPDLNAIQAMTAKLPPKSVIFFLLYFHDQNGKPCTPYKVVQYLARTATAPMFTHWDTLMGSGVVGGYLLSGEKVGEQIAAAISAYMENRDQPNAYWSVEDSDTLCEHIYDWRQMQRWNISKRSLPEDSIILYRPPSSFESAPIRTGVLWGAPMAAGILLIAWAVEMVRHRRTAAKLAAIIKQLGISLKTGPDPVMVYDPQGKVLYLNPEFHRCFGWKESQLDYWHLPYISQEVRNAFRDMIQKVTECQETARIETQGLTAKGAAMDIIASAAMIPLNGQSESVVVVTLTDVSQRNQLTQQICRAN